MKKLFFIAASFAAMTFAFTACNDKDKNNPETPNTTDNTEESGIVDPKQVTAEDFTGEWRTDSMIAPSYRFYGRGLVDFSKITVKDGIVSTTKQVYDSETGEDKEEAVTYEIISFDRGIKFAALKEKDVKLLVWSDEEQKDVEVVEDVIHYFSTLPAMDGKDVAISEENVKGIGFEEYVDYQSSDQPMNRSVSPHYNFDYFGDDHQFMNFMAVEMNPINAFPHPGFWWFKDGAIEFIEAYSGQTIDDFNPDDYGWWKIEKLTDKHMVIHRSYKDGSWSSEETIYYSRCEMPELLKDK